MSAGSAYQWGKIFFATAIGATTGAMIGAAASSGVGTGTGRERVGIGTEIVPLMPLGLRCRQREHHRPGRR
ncbi:hypothetical protein ABIB80_000270 [Bradyrhizobium sp. i1.15.2]